MPAEINPQLRLKNCSLSRFPTSVLSFMVMRSFLDSASHTLIVLSAEHEVIHFPSDENEQELTLKV